MSKTRSAKEFFKRINPFNVIYFTQYIAQCFGVKFTLMISSVYYGLKGFNNYGVQASLLPYSKAIPLSPQTYLTTVGLLQIPWAVKGFYGVSSDIFPIFGYRKKYYMMISCLLAVISLIIIIFTPYSAVQSFELLPAILLFFVHGAGALCDLLCEGKYVDQMKKKPETKHAIVIYVWWCQLFGGMLSLAIVGPMADAFDPRYLFIIFVPLALQTCVFLFYGCMIDDTVEPHQSNRLDMRLLYLRWKLISMAMLTAIGALGNFFAALTGNSTIQAAYALACSAFMCLVGFYFLSPLIAKANFYIFLTFLLYVNITGPLEYFYTAGEDCVVDGPGFNMTFYKTYTGIVGQIFSLFGLFLYNRYIARLRFRAAFWLTTFIRVFISIFDIILTQRWNKAIGVSDHILYILGNGAIYQTSYMMDFLPSTLLMAKLCPKEVESTVYAILAGFANFGISCSAFLGVFFSDLMKIDGLPISDDGTPCNFNNLTWLVVLCHAVLPLLAVPFTFILIPNTHIKDDLLGETAVDVTETSQENYTIKA